MTDKIRFEHLGLSKRVLDAINKKGFEEPSHIQALTIPVMLLLLQESLPYRFPRKLVR